MNVLTTLLRFVGRCYLALAQEIDDAMADYAVETAWVPDTVPAEWECDE